MLEIRPAQGKGRLPTSEHGGCGKKDMEKRAVRSWPTQTPVVMIAQVVQVLTYPLTIQGLDIRL